MPQVWHCFLAHRVFRPTGRCLQSWLGRFQRFTEASRYSGLRFPFQEGLTSLGEITMMQTHIIQHSNKTDAVSFRSLDTLSQWKTLLYLAVWGVIFSWIERAPSPWLVWRSNNNKRLHRVYNHCNPASSCLLPLSAEAASGALIPALLWSPWWKVARGRTVIKYTFIIITFDIEFTLPCLHMFRFKRCKSYLINTTGFPPALGNLKELAELVILCYSTFDNTDIKMGDSRKANCLNLCRDSSQSLKMDKCNNHHCLCTLVTNWNNEIATCRAPLTHPHI